MINWLESVYSDGTAEFVSAPTPRLGETVTVMLRMMESAPVRHVLLRLLRNGGEELMEMHPVKTVRGLTWYAVSFPVRERRLAYRFNLICPEEIWFYTQRGLSRSMPDSVYDFVLLCDYVPPAWVKEAVFYQIFPERFCNGNPDNDVKSGEYSQNGHPSIQMPSWDAVPLPYEKGFCLDFFGGDLEGIRQKIPYLKELGVTALYLNPIFTAPSVHKYDCIDYFHVDPHFGGDAALAELSQALHEQGMKLILDISINHTGSDHRWFNKDAVWFNKSVGAYHNPDAQERAYYFLGKDNRYRAWWDVPTLPTLNYTSQELREIMYRGENSVLKTWLKSPYNIDGWRFDVADVVGCYDEVQLSHELWPEIRRSIRDVNPQAYILAEDWNDCYEHLQGDEWDAPMNYYGCARLIREFFGEPERFMGERGWLEGMHIRMRAEDLQERVLSYLGKLPQAIRDNQFNLFDSHDVSRLHNNPAIHPEELRGAAIFQFMLPGTPSIYYGDELEVDGSLGSNEGCRYPMPWGKERGESFHVYQTLSHLKQKHKALSSGGMKFLYAKGRVFALARFWEEEVFVAVISGSDEEEAVRLPLAVLGCVSPEGKRDVFGREMHYVNCEEETLLTVPPHQSFLFRALAQ